MSIKSEFKSEIKLKSKISFSEDHLQLTCIRESKRHTFLCWLIDDYSWTIGPNFHSNIVLLVSEYPYHKWPNTVTIECIPKQHIQL